MFNLIIVLMSILQLYASIDLWCCFSKTQTKLHNLLVFYSALICYLPILNNLHNSHISYHKMQYMNIYLVHTYFRKILILFNIMYSYSKLCLWKFHSINKINHSSECSVITNTPLSHYLPILRSLQGTRIN